MTTNDEHLAELLELAEVNEKTAAWMTKQTATPIAKKCAKRAAAIRWILAETAHPVEENTAV